MEEKGKHNLSHIITDVKIKPEGGNASNQNHEINLDGETRSILLCLFIPLI